MKSNWQTKKLAEIGTIFNGNSINEDVKKKKYLNIKGGLPYVGTKDIDPNLHSIDYDNGVRIPLGEKGFKIARKNSILICAEGGNAGKKIAQTTQDICFGNKLFALETNSLADPRFVFYWYLNPTFAESYKTKMRGLIGGVSMNSFKNLLISLPPIAEQKRIAEILDEVFAKTAKAQENTEKNLQNSRELFKSYLNNIFASTSKDWGEKRLKEVCEELLAGGDVPKNNFSKIKTGKYFVPVFANGVKDKGLYGYTDIKKVIKPSITISARGTIGYSEIRQEVFYPIVRLIVLVPNVKIINLLFLYYITRNFKFSNTGSSIPQLTIPMIENIKITLPSLTKQKVIVSKINALSVETKKLENNYKQKLADLIEFKKSVLKKAFSGELIQLDKQKTEAQIPNPSPYIRNQVHAAIIERVAKDGGWTTEVAMAKYDHLLQEVYGLPLGYQFQTQQFGPFDAQIKRLVWSGLGRNKWFAKRKGMIIFGSNINTLLLRQSNIYRAAQSVMKELAKLGVTKLNAEKIELLSTVCHSIKETKSTVPNKIREYMSQWSTDGNRTKADKFSFEQIQKCLNFITKNNLHLRLLKTI